MSEKPDIGSVYYVVTSTSDKIYTIVKGTVSEVREISYHTYQMHSMADNFTYQASFTLDVKEQKLSPFDTVNFAFKDLTSAKNKCKQLLKEQAEGIKTNRAALLNQSKKLSEQKKKIKTLIFSLDNEGNKS